MKRVALIVLLVIFGLVWINSAAVSAEVTIFGPQQYVRTSGAPDLYTDIFSGVSGQGWIVVKNGNYTGGNRVDDGVSSASVSVNGVEIFGSNDFSNQVYILESAVSLAEQNTISVELASAPGSYITVDITEDIPDPTVSLSAAPTTIISGESATLSWSSSNANTVIIDQGIDSVDLNGSVTVSPTETTTYTITATNLSRSVTDSAIVTVSSQIPTIEFHVNPTTIVLGESATLSWTTAHADTVTIDQGIGAVENNGSITVSPTATTYYVITATNQVGTTYDWVACNVTYIPPTVQFTADPDTIELGESATLSWETTDAHTVTIDQGIGVVSVDGSVVVSPTERTTYKLLATGSSGTAVKYVTVTVTVSPKPPTVDINADPAVIESGEPTFLTWSSLDAYSASINNGVGPVPVNGTITVYPEYTKTYTITVIGSLGAASADTKIVVTGDPEPQGEGTFGNQYNDLVPPDATVASYDSDRFSLITGSVYDLSDIPINNVLVTILEKPEYGTVETGSDGRFSIPVEGGSTLTLVYQKEGLLTVHRKVKVPWNDIAISKTIKMMTVDPIATTFTFDGNSGTMATHQSSTVSDEFGSRSISMILTGDNQAYFVDENGNDIYEVETITARATEYTTPGSMPAILPPNSAYTYCVELAVDGLSNVRFTNPVITYTDNFLGFDVGEIVPVGYYDRHRGVWIPSDNGQVIELLDTDADGIIDSLDADGNGLPNDLDNDGSFIDEVIGLEDAAKYTPGSTYWRVAISHFTPWDSNWPYMPPSDAISPNPDDTPVVDSQNDDDQTCSIDDVQCVNSYVKQTSRTFHEDIPIPGTDVMLHYSSNRTGGYYVYITVPASGGSVPSSLKRIIVKLEAAGQTFEQILDPLPDQIAEFVWDGLDYLGRRSGLTKAHVSIGFEYDFVYRYAENPVRIYSQAFAQAGDVLSGVNGREGIISWRNSDILVNGSKQGTNSLAEGWSLSSHHHMNLWDTSILYKGNGTTSSNDMQVITTIGGNGIYGPPGNNIPATESRLSSPTNIAVDATGDIYIAETSINKIFKIDKDGIITKIAGNGTCYGSDEEGVPAISTQVCQPRDINIDVVGNLYITVGNKVRKIDTNGIINTIAGQQSSGYNGDNIPATEALLNHPEALAVDSVGNVYVADTYNYRIRKIDTNGIITTVAGNGTNGPFYYDNIPATVSSLGYISGLSIDRAGNLYMTDSNYHNIGKVDTSGIITTVAGNVYNLSCGYNGDGIPAIGAELCAPRGIEVDSSGNIYLSDSGNDRIRKIDNEGIISTFAGTGDSGFNGEGILSNKAEMDFPWGIAIDSLNRVYFSDYYNYRIRRISIPLAFQSLVALGGRAFAGDDGLVHLISPTGLHTQSLNIDTGVAINTFEYDQDNNHVAIVDQFGNETQINRDVNGIPTAIISPDGITTTLTIDGNNHLTGISHPDGGNYDFEYDQYGLMTAEIEPKLNRFDHAYDQNGRLLSVTDEEGGNWEYTRITDSENGRTIEISSAEGNIATFYDKTETDGTYISTAIDPTGAETHLTRSEDGQTATKSLPCGMEIEYNYDLDPEYKYKVVTQMKESTPAGLQKITTSNTIYDDTNSDEVPDIKTETVTVNGKSTIFNKNTLLNKKVMTSPEGRSITSFYSPNTLLTESVSVAGLFDTDFGYDTKGRLTSTSTDTRQTDFTYNANGFLESVTDAENHTTSYTYDAMGRVTQVDRPDNTSLWFSYDLNGNMAVLTNPFSINHEFGYNAVNLNDSYLTPLSGSYSYVYDFDRRLVQINFPSGTQINNIYADGRLSQVLTPEGNIDYTYLCSTKVDTISKGTETTSYGYDGSLITSETLGGTLNQTLSFTYDNDFEVTSFNYAGATESFTYDNDGLLIGAGYFSIARNVDNGLPETVSGGTYSLSRTFNGFGELDEESTVISGLGVYTWNVVRDGNGRIIQKSETVGGVTANYVYTYDAVGRLLTVTKGGVLVEDYQYDSNGTRSLEINTLRGITSRSFAYSDEDHLLTAGTVSYQYDLDGFLVSKTNGANVTGYNYSSRGELLSVTMPDGTLIEYGHDPLGRRISKKVNGVVIEKYLWQGLTRLLAVFDGADNLVMRFEYADGRMPVAMTKAGSTYYLSYDQVGSLRVVADTSGNVVKRIECDSFGNVISDSNPAFAGLFGFAGGLSDSDTGLVRFGYRDYDPDTGRWTAKDLILFAGGDTDLYGYVQNDPVNGIDPYGLINWGQVGIGAASTIGGVITGAAGVAVVGIGVAEFGTIPVAGPIGLLTGIHTVGLGGTLFGAGVGMSGYGLNQVWQGIFDGDGNNNTQPCSGTGDSRPHSIPYPIPTRPSQPTDTLIPYP